VEASMHGLLVICSASGIKLNLEIGGLEVNWKLIMKEVSSPNSKFP
jgi:hypothetical protein